MSTDSMAEFLDKMSKMRIATFYRKYLWQDLQKEKQMSEGYWRLLNEKEPIRVDRDQYWNSGHKGWTPSTAPGTVGANSCPYRRWVPGDVLGDFKRYCKAEYGVNDWSRIDAIFKKPDGPIQLRRYKELVEIYIGCCMNDAKVAEPEVTGTVMKTKHDDDCTIYSCLNNGKPEDGVCTCGYGLEVIRETGGIRKHMYSEELISAAVRHPKPPDSRVTVNQMTMTPKSDHYVTIHRSFWCWLRDLLKLARASCSDGACQSIDTMLSDMDDYDKERARE